MPVPDPMFRQRLRQYHRDLRDQRELLERGSAAWFDCDKAMGAIARLHVTLYKEPLERVHSIGEHGPQ